MKNRKCKILIVFMLFLCFPVTAFASSGSTDVYIGVSTNSKSNMQFLIVDEQDNPIKGASIDLWTNESLKYQLLGVSQERGNYDTSLPYGTHKYKVYMVGYEMVEDEVVLPNVTDPYIEKIVLKRSQELDKNRDPASDVNTGDSTTFVYLFYISIISLLMTMLFIKKNITDIKNKDK